MNDTHLSVYPDFEGDARDEEREADDEEELPDREAKRQLRQRLIMMSLVVFALLYTLFGLVYCILVTTGAGREHSLPKTPSLQGYNVIWGAIPFAAWITWRIRRLTRRSRPDFDDIGPSLSLQHHVLAALYCIGDLSLCALGIVLLCFIVRRPTQQLLALIT